VRDRETTMEVIHELAKLEPLIWRLRIRPVSSHNQELAVAKQISVSDTGKLEPGRPGGKNWSSEMESYVTPRF
jgi:hypothetical protein